MVMRAYTSLRKDKKIDLIRNIKNSLLVEKIKGDKTSFSNLFFKINCNDLDLPISQFVSLRTETANFNQSILCSYISGKSLIFPLPKAWQSVIQGYGINVNSMLCSILWVGVVFLYWFRGVMHFISSVSDQVIRFPQKNTHDNYRY